MTGANVHDSKRLEPVLTGIVVKRAMPTKLRHNHLCADAGYRGAELLRIIEWHGYIPHVVVRRQEADAKWRHPAKKARRWVVKVSHSWFNLFRKLLVRYEKLHRSFMALNHLAEAIVAFRKVPLAGNIIYRQALNNYLRTEALLNLGRGAEAEPLLAGLEAKKLNAVHPSPYWSELLKAETARLYLLKGQRVQGQALLADAVLGMTKLGAKGWETERLQRLLVTRQ